MWRFFLRVLIPLSPCNFGGINTFDEHGEKADINLNVGLLFARDMPKSARLKPLHPNAMPAILPVQNPKLGSAAIDKDEYVALSNLPLKLPLHDCGETIVTLAKVGGLSRYENSATTPGTQHARAA